MANADVIERDKPRKNGMAQGHLRYPVTHPPRLKADQKYLSTRKIAEKYPRLKNQSFLVIDSRGKKSPHGGQLEFYHPDEPRSPFPGAPVVEVFNPELEGEALDRAIVGDMLHYLPESDPNFARYRELFRQTITPEQEEVDRRAYERAKSRRGEDRPYDKWFDMTRLDAYLRGYLAPDERDEWRESGTYTPIQTRLLDEIQSYLMSE